MDFESVVSELNSDQLAELSAVITKRQAKLRREQLEVNEMLARRESGVQGVVSNGDAFQIQAALEHIGYNKSLFEQAKGLVEHNVYTATQIYKMSNTELRSALSI